MIMNKNTAIIAPMAALGVPLSEVGGVGVGVGEDGPSI